MANTELTEWHYRETLARCTHFLCTEYNIPCQVDELITSMYSQGVITESDTLYITESVHTRDKLRQLLNLIKDSNHQPIAQTFDLLIQHLSNDKKRLDIPRKLRETLNDVSKLDPRDEEELYDRVRRIEENFLYVTPFEVQQSLKMILTDYESWQRRYAANPGVPDESDESECGNAPVIATKEDDTITGKSALMQAAMTDDVKTLTTILNNSLSNDAINEVNAEHQSLLSVACQNSSGEFVRQLLRDDRVDVNCRDTDGMTAFMYSVIRGDVSVITVLLDCDRLDTNVRDTNSLTYVWYICGMTAAKHLLLRLKVGNDRTELTKVMDKFADFPQDLKWDVIENVVKVLLSSDRIDKIELLEYMLLVGNESIVSLILLDDSVIITAIDVENVILMMICSHHPQTIRLAVCSNRIPFELLDEYAVNRILNHARMQTTENVADLMVVVTKGLNDKALSLAMSLLSMSSLHAFAMCQILEYYQISSLNLLDRKGNSVLMLLCKYGNYTLLSELFKYVAADQINVNHKNIKQQTMLMLAFKNSCRYVPLLVYNQVKTHLNINDSNRKGVSYLMMASESDNRDMVNSLLLCSTIRINACDNNGSTALIVSSRHGHTSIISQLLNQGADPNRAGPDDTLRRTALHFAVRSNNVSAVSELIHYGADVNVTKTDMFGCTPLHHACLLGHDVVASMLIESHADVNAVTTQGWTPLFYACKHGSDSTVAELISAGADVNFKMNSGWTAFLFACEYGHVSIVSKLIANGADMYTRPHGEYKRVQKQLHGIDIDTSDKETPVGLKIAKARGFDDIVQLLNKVMEDNPLVNK